MSFAAQLAARAEATTKRTSSGGSSIGSPPQSQSISPSLSESIKNRVSASTTEQSTNNKQPSTTSSSSGWKPKQQQQKKKKNKKKLVPISPEVSPIIDSSYRDVETRHTNTKKHQPQDVTNNNNSSNSVSASTSTTKSSMLPATATEEDSKRMSFGSAIKAADKISSSRENSKEDDDEAVKQSQSISTAEQSNTQTTTYTKKDSSSSSEQRLSSTTQALDTQLDLSIENLQLQSSLHDIQTKYKQLELQLKEKKKDDKGIITTTQTQNQNLVYTRKSSDAMSSIGGASGWKNAVPTKTGRGEGQLLQRETSGISVESFITHDELMEENVRLTQLILDIGQLEELEKLRRSGGEDNITQQQPSSDKAKATIQQLQRELTRVNKNSTYTSEKDNTIQRLQDKLAETEFELKDITELKNAEIALLRKQLDRAEHLVQKRDKEMHKDTKEEVPSSWSKEREGLRDEIRRLNVELSNLKGELLRANSADEEELADLAKYNQVNNNNSDGTASPSRKQQLDSTDVTSLQSIIEMMRQTIEQNTREKKVLEERLEEEQTRSQMELQAFARTLEGVDDLRQSAESMSREIRRIKVKGYRPTRSDLFGNSNTLEGGSNFGELTKAVEASDNMEAAIRLIENQNDKMEERRRMNLVVASSSVEEKKEKSKNYPGLSPIRDDDGDGFLSFWNRGDENEDDIVAKKEKKRKSKKKKKHTGGGGSVLTSFF